MKDSSHTVFPAAWDLYPLHDDQKAGCRLSLVGFQVQDGGFLEGGGGGLGFQLGDGGSSRWVAARWWVMMRASRRVVVDSRWVISGRDDGELQ